MNNRFTIVSDSAAAGTSSANTAQAIEVRRSPTGAQQVTIDFEIVIGGERIRVGGVRVEVPDDRPTPTGGTRETPIPGFKIEPLPPGAGQQN